MYCSHWCIDLSSGVAKQDAEMREVRQESTQFFRDFSITFNNVLLTKRSATLNRPMHQNCFRRQTLLGKFTTPVGWRWRPLPIAYPSTHRPVDLGDFRDIASYPSTQYKFLITGLHCRPIHATHLVIKILATPLFLSRTRLTVLTCVLRNDRLTV